jgi:hypothetical protein
LKSRNQLAERREILFPSLVDQIMQRFFSIAHIKQAAGANLDA